MAAVSQSLRPSTVNDADARLTDSHGRIIHDLRVSITDSCNYKCVYCRTGEVGAQYPELDIEEYLRLIRLFVSVGITKVRLTGGEPLLRRGLVEMVQELARMRTLAGDPLDLALTTNGHLLGALARQLKAAGLNRVTVSMDAVDAPTFERITRVPGSFQKVLAGIRAARTAGLTPLKINCVLMRGFNDDQIEAFARFARQENVIVRFIEFMPLEEGRLWTPLHICGRRGRNRHHRACQPGLLWRVQPAAPYLRRQNTHLPVFPGRARSLRSIARRGSRCGTPGLHYSYRSR
jgi:cyclic pyranopterin phosphate synthase